jgi:endonuclease III
MRQQIGAHELSLDPSAGREKDLFAWLVASFLFGKRIQQGIAKAAYEAIVEKHKIDTVDKMAGCTHHQLVSMLGEGGYARYDESTATRLTALCKGIQRDYKGSVKRLVEQSGDKQELKSRLEAFDGIGPKTAEIFIRDAWKG